MNPYLLPVLEFGPVVMERLVAQIDHSRLDEPSHPGRFSARQVVAHMADWEPILLERMKAGHANPGATIQPFDEGQMAVDHNYVSSDVQEELRKFKEARRRTAEWLRSLSPDEMSRHVSHPERGVMTIADQAGMLIGHDMYHLEQLSGLLGEKTVATW